MKGPARRRALLALGLVTVLVLGACKAPGGNKGADDGVGGDGLPRPELGITPSPLPEAGATTATTTASGPGTTASIVPGGGTSTTAAGGGPGTTTSTTVPDTYRTVGSSPDPRGDHGSDGPGYADLVRLTVERGTRTMRLTVEVGGTLPAALAPGEVEGFGVDLFRGVGLESAYQVFVDGGSDGWRAYFQRGNDFVLYPGTFRLGGSRLEFVVPLSAFADGDPERASAFADWSQDTDAGKRNSEDLLPDLGAVQLSR